MTPVRRPEQLFFAVDRPPLPPEKDLYQRIRLDKTTGKLATEFTPAGAIEEKVFKVYPDEYRAWAEEHGIPQPPRDQSEAFQFAPNVSIRQPVEGEVLSGIVTVIGSADVSSFESYELQYGISHDPGAFSQPFSGPHRLPRDRRHVGPLGCARTLRWPAHSEPDRARHVRHRI